MSDDDDATRQQQEIEALMAILEHDFVQHAAPKAWKGAGALKELGVQIRHPTPHLSDKFSLQLSIQLPRAYPSKACPILHITQPIVGIRPDALTRIHQAIKQEVQSLKGAEMLFQLVTVAQELIAQEYPEHKHPKPFGSLAAELNVRESEARYAEKLEEEKRVRTLVEQRNDAAAKLTLQIQQTAEQMVVKEKIALEQHKRKSRASIGLETTTSSSNDLVLTFDEVVITDQCSEVQSVRLYSPKPGLVGTTYVAEAICNHQHPNSLECHVITFMSSYYKSARGFSKIKDAAKDIVQLTKLTHESLQRLYAVKAIPGDGNEFPKLCILTDSRPGTPLRLVLEACGSLSQAKVLHFLEFTIRALQGVHSKGLFHGALDSSCIVLHTSADNQSTVRLIGVYYVARLLALQKANPFGLTAQCLTVLPETWLPEDKIRSPSLLSFGLDMHQLGVLMTEMFYGLGATTEYPTPLAATANLPIALRLLVQKLLHPQVNVTCQSILAGMLQDATFTQDGSSVFPARQENNDKPRNWLTAAQTMPPRALSQGSRYRSEWEELEFLGSGGFGEVVKSKNQLDSRVYAIKKIRLKPRDTDVRIFREVNTLAALSHRSIVRYYTAWIEQEDSSLDVTDTNSSMAGTNSDDSARTRPQHRDLSVISFGDFTGSVSHHESFPGIYFADNSRLSDGSEVSEKPSTSVSSPTAAHFPASTLYIQMEFVENMTLKERILEGMDEDEAWRLFYQLVDALVYMTNLGIVHRDIKPGNIFIDINGDCKIGDFGLATSGLAFVQSDVDNVHQTTDIDRTRGIGTRLYVAPELQNPSSNNQSQGKADIYSLGIVFFEMNFFFKTGAERIAVIEGLRDPHITFPGSWESHRTRQKDIITQLLQHNPRNRPSAIELSQNPLLPSRIGDDSLQAALKVITRDDSVHFGSVLSQLFSHEPSVVRSVLYDDQVDRSSQTSFDDLTEEHIKGVFRLHGAVHMEPPLLSPLLPLQHDDTRVYRLLDIHGQVMTLPKNLLLPFARLAARTKVRRIKRYHIGHAYRTR